VLTGDIMEERGPDQLVYIDRRNDVLKLAQGEFVATGALGVAFENGSEVIHQIYVYGSATRSYLLAVVVPNLELVRFNLGHEPDELELRALIRAELKKVAASGELRSFEVPRDFIVELEPFSQTNDLLTSLGKRKRSSIQRLYGDRLEQLYADLEHRQQDELANLSNAESALSVLEKIGKALEASLGIYDIDLANPSSFSELGGDSLGASAFSSLLEGIFGVEVAVNSILSPAGNPAVWARTVESALKDDSRRVPTFAGVHGKHACELDAKDLALEAFLNIDALKPVDRKSASKPPRTVFLTGATGFLGRFLCLEWLERLSEVEGGKLICLVRAPDQVSARRRLDDAFRGHDEGLDQRYRELSADTLEVVVGDIAEVSLGLAESEFSRLASDVDHIVHPAALVNHVLEYEYLFGPNVAGTAALVGLALTGRQKGIDFVSTAAVANFLDRGNSDNEDSPLLDRVALSAGYANGYGASKWASEQILHQASQRFGLSVNVFRGDMMMPHRKFREQLNADDIVTRLFHDVIVTELAPFSFYILDRDGAKARAHYDGLPVDFIAAAMAEIGATPHQGLRTFNVTNHSDDGLSLDVFVDWIEEAGYRIERVGDYDEWLQRFEAKLKALPEEKRQQSSLYVLEYLRRPIDPRRSEPGSQRFDETVSALTVGPGTPQLRHDFIDKYLEDMRRLGLIPNPDPRVPRPEQHHEA
jgi:fatty acid CoA ligase FadD9